MSVMEKTEENEQEGTENVLAFAPRPMRGGTGTPTYFKNWLADLPEGTVFLSRLRMPEEVTLTEFVVYNARPDKATMLIVRQHMREFHIWVDTVRFSRDNELVEVLRQEDNNLNEVLNRKRKEEKKENE